MLGQLEMEEEVEDRRASLQRTQLERESREGGEELAAAQASLATAQVRRGYVEMAREVERKREEAEEAERERDAQVKTLMV